MNVHNTRAPPPPYFDYLGHPLLNLSSYSFSHVGLKICGVQFVTPEGSQVILCDCVCMPFGAYYYD